MPDTNELPGHQPLEHTDKSSQTESLIPTELHVATALIENIRGAVITTDADYHITGWNKGAEEMYGYTREEVLGEKASDVIRTQFSNEDERKQLQEVLNSLGYWQGEVIQEKRNGDNIHVLASVASIKNNTGKLIGSVGVNRDITERKKTEEDLKTTKDQLELTFRNVPAAIFLFNQAGKILFVNGKAATLMGFSSVEEVLKETNLQTLKNKVAGGFEMRSDNNELVDFAETPTSVTIRTGKASEMIHQLKNKNTGQIIWMLSKAEPLLDESGNLKMVLASSTDITLQKMAEEKTKENEERFRTLANSISQLAWMANADGWIYWYNQRWYDYTGTTLEEMQGWGWEKVHHPEHIDRVMAFVKQAWTGDEPFEMTFPLKGKNNNFRWFLTRAYPVKNAQGKVTEWIGTNTDIDDYKKALELKDEFLGIASHELRTPLTSLKGFSHILELKLQQDGNAESLGLLSKMNNQIDKLSTLVLELLDVTKIENGQLDFVIERFDFSELVKEIGDEMQRTTQSHQINVDTGEQTIISGDRNRIGQVIINFISNAIKYSPDANKILVSSRKEENQVKLSVQDFGIGIPEESLPHIFERFFRVPGQRMQTFPGLGLGLFISEQVIRRHNGKFEVTSAEGKGSTFSFILPIEDE